MKLNKTLLLIPLLMSCGSTISEDLLTNPNIQNTNLSIVCPTGAPAIAFYNHAIDKNFETNSVPSNIIAMMTGSNSKDAVVIDTISGLKAIKKGANYKIAATITFGNFYIAGTGSDLDNTLNENDKIVLFGENQTPDLIFHYLFGNQFDEQIEYVTNVQDAATVLASGKNVITGNSVDYVFIAEPVLTKILNNANAKTYGKSYVYLDVQSAYKEKSKGNTLIQASLFLKNGQNTRDTAYFLENLNDDITKGIENPTLIKNGLNLLPIEEQNSIFGIDSNVIDLTMKDNLLGLGFKLSKTIKNDIDNFVKIFDMENTNEEIYY